MDSKQLLDTYFSLTPPERREQLALLQESSLQPFLDAAQGEKARAATRILADYGSRAAAFVNAHLDTFLPLLRNADPKVRANTAELIGATAAARCLSSLTAALDEEQTMYVRPSFLLAIGRAKNAAAEEYLRSYTVRSDVEKHRLEEKQALTKALANFVRKETPNVRVLPTDIIVVSTPNASVTLEAFSRAGMNAKKLGAYVAVSGLRRFQDIYRIRAYITAYIYLGSCPVSELPSLLASREKAILQRTGVRGFRLEVKNVPHKERVDLIGKCLDAVELLENSPSSYSIEILAEIEGDRAWLFLNPLSDPRFAYRRKSVPASIGPGVAACVISYAAEYFTSDARVLDDFCGAGTLLFERSFYPYRALTGIDQNPQAIKAARENSRYARAHPHFHLANALQFTGRQYQEVITNMPFGLRVGSHEINEELYRRYIRVLPAILSDRGIAVLYTHEKKLTEKLIADAPVLEPLKRTTFRAGGLFPAVYVLRRRGPR